MARVRRADFIQEGGGEKGKKYEADEEERKLAWQGGGPFLYCPQSEGKKVPRCQEQYRGGGAACNTRRMSCHRREKERGEGARYERELRRVCDCVFGEERKKKARSGVASQSPTPSRGKIAYQHQGVEGLPPFQE